MSGEVPSNSGIQGQPVKIIEIIEGEFKLNEKELQNILHHPKAKSKKVCVLSVAGAFRKGKSFLLNFILRYLTGGGRDNWIGSDDEPLTGFHWRRGATRDTTGILMWSEPFIMKRESSKEEIAVLIMDTQGAFDSHGTVKECTTVFALSIMLSSVQVYNILATLQENDLQHLQFSNGYGKLALKDSNVTPFQRLIFLIRDWPYKEDHPYGFVGGSEVLKEVLEIKEDQKEEIKDLRVDLKSSFKSLECFLMPHPGLEMVENKDSDNGMLKNMRPDFKIQVKCFIESTFSPYIQVKEINGEEITSERLFEYFKVFCRTIKSGDLPEIKSLFDATAQINNEGAKANSIKFYKSAMDKECGGDKPYMSADKLEAAHNKIREDSKMKFLSARKMGGTTFSARYLEELEKEINELFIEYQKQNDKKKTLIQKVYDDVKKLVKEKIVELDLPSKINIAIPVVSTLAGVVVVFASAAAIATVESAVLVAGFTVLAPIGGIFFVLGAISLGVFKWTKHLKSKKDSRK